MKQILYIICLISLSNSLFGQIQVVNVTNASSLSNCDGSATVSANGTAGPFTFQWSNGSNGTTAINLCPGVYYVTVSNAYGCETPVAIIVRVNCSSAYTFSIIGDITNACGSTPTGKITNVRGIGSYNPNDYTYTYLWDDGSTKDNRNNLTPGVYCVTVTNYHRHAPKCTQVECFTVGSNNPNNQLNNMVKPCYGESTGSIDITSWGSTPNSYSYTWSNGRTSEDLTNLSAGTYKVTATDQTGCSVVKSYKLDEYSEIIVNYSVEKTCPNSSDGSISTNVSGGNAPYTYSWNTGATSNNLNNIGVGSYSLTVTDKNGCRKTINATIIEEQVTEIVNPNNCRYTNLWCKGSIIGSNYYGTYLAFDPNDCRFENEYCSYNGQLVNFHVVFHPTTLIPNGSSCTVSEMCANGNLLTTHFGTPQSQLFSGVDNFGPFCDFVTFCDLPNLGAYYVMNVQNQLSPPSYSLYHPSCPKDYPHLRSYLCNGTVIYTECIAGAIPPGGGGNNNEPSLSRLDFTGQFIEAYSGHFHLDYERAMSGGQISPSNQTLQEIKTTNISTVYPNPFNNEINVKLKLSKPNNINILLTNMLGEQVLFKNYSLSTGEQTISLKLSEHLARGLYFVTVNYEDGQKEVHKLIH